MPLSLIEHTIEFRSPVGILLSVIGDGGYAGMTYTFRDNQVGVLELYLPDTFDWSFIPIDGQIEVYRSYGGSTLRREGDTTFFIRKREMGSDKNGVKSIHITAYSATHLLLRRIVAYYSGTSYTEKVSIPWDNMMREIVDENYGPTAEDPDRDLTPWLTVEADRHYGASYTRSFPWRVVLNVLQDICNDVRNQGEYASVDVFRLENPSSYEFRVFIGARGNDHSSDSANPVIVSEEHHNLSSGRILEDWEDEKNYIYATGQGQGEERAVQTAQDDTRITISPFNRVEFNRDARQVEIDESLLAEATGALEEFRPRKIFTGSIVQTEGSIYGIHWGWGDIVTAEYEGESFDCHVDAVTITIDDKGTEVVEGLLRSEVDVT